MARKPKREPEPLTISPADQKRLVTAFRAWLKAHRKRKATGEDVAQFFLDVVCETNPRLCDYGETFRVLSEAGLVG